MITIITNSLADRGGQEQISGLRSVNNIVIARSPSLREWLAMGKLEGAYAPSKASSNKLEYAILFLTVSDPAMKNSPEATDLKDVFNEIAPGWYNFRHRSIFRRELEMLAQRWQRGRLLNLGCAHGPDFLPFASGFDLYGVDFSTQMLSFARKYSQKFGFAANLALADVRHLPFADGVFDWAISVATYHHISGKTERPAALSELRRVLKPGGEAFITVWNRWQPRFWWRGSETAVPWRTGERTLYRYYYLFSYPELKRLAEQAGLKVLRAYPESAYHFPIKLFSRNICLLVRKSD